jgi:hypothetical protein
MWERSCTDTPAVLSRIWNRAVAGQLGEALQQTCSAAPAAPAELCRLAERLREPVKDMELGLVHCDLFLEQIGRHRPSVKPPRPNCPFPPLTLGCSPCYSPVNLLRPT